MMITYQHLNGQRRNASTNMDAAIRHEQPEFSQHAILDLGMGRFIGNGLTL